MLLSPEKTKLGCCELAPVLVPVGDEELLKPEVAPLRPAEIPDEVRKSIQGTATCLPPAEELVAELIPVLEVEPEVALLLPATEFPFSDRIANSTLPDPGFMMMSLIVPISLPEEPLTWAAVNWLPRIASWPIRPVALKCLPLQPDWLLDGLLEAPEELGLVVPGVVELPLLVDGSVEDPPGEVWACVPSAKPAAHATIAAINCCFITCLSCSCQAKPKPTGGGFTQ